jgi:hypothetical protein
MPSQSEPCQKEIQLEKANSRKIHPEYYKYYKNEQGQAWRQREALAVVRRRSRICLMHGYLVPGMNDLTCE